MRRRVPVLLRVRTFRLQARARRTARREEEPYVKYLLVFMLLAACTFDVTPDARVDTPAAVPTQLHLTGSLVDHQEHGFGCTWQANVDVIVLGLDGVASIAEAVPPVPCT